MLLRKKKRKWSAKYIKWKQKKKVNLVLVSSFVVIFLASQTMKTICPDLKVSKKLSSFCMMNGVSKISLVNVFIFNSQVSACAESSYLCISLPRTSISQILLPKAKFFFPGNTMVPHEQNDNCPSWSCLAPCTQIKNPNTKNFI